MGDNGELVLFNPGRPGMSFESNLILPISALEDWTIPSLIELLLQSGIQVFGVFSWGAHGKSVHRLDNHLFVWLELDPLGTKKESGRSSRGSRAPMRRPCPCCRRPFCLATRS